MMALKLIYLVVTILMVVDRTEGNFLKSLFNKKDFNDQLKRFCTELGVVDEMNSKSCAKEWHDYLKENAKTNYGAIIRYGKLCKHLGGSVQERSKSCLLQIQYLNSIDWLFEKAVDILIKIKQAKQLGEQRVSDFVKLEEWKTYHWIESFNLPSCTNLRRGESRWDILEYYKLYKMVVNYNPYSSPVCTCDEVYTLNKILLEHEQIDGEDPKYFLKERRGKQTAVVVRIKDVFAEICLSRTKNFTWGPNELLAFRSDPLSKKFKRHTVDAKLKFFTEGVAMKVLLKKHTFKDGTLIVADEGWSFNESISVLLGDKLNIITNPKFTALVAKTKLTAEQYFEFQKTVSGFSFDSTECLSQLLKVFTRVSRQQYSLPLSFTSNVFILAENSRQHHCFLINNFLKRVKISMDEYFGSPKSFLGEETLWPMEVLWAMTTDAKTKQFDLLKMGKCIEIYFSIEKKKRAKTKIVNSNNKNQKEFKEDFIKFRKSFIELGCPNEFTIIDKVPSKRTTA